MGKINWHVVYGIVTVFLVGANVWIYREYRAICKDMAEMLQRNRQYKGEVEVSNSSIVFLAHSASNMYKYEGHHIQDCVVEDNEGVNHKLSELLNGKSSKIVVFFSSQNCESCVSSMFRTLNEYYRDVNTDELVVVGEFANKRAAKAYVSKDPIPFTVYYKNDEQPIDVLDNESTPFMCVMKSDLIMHDVAFPVKEVPLYTHLYTKAMEEKYFK